jgi:maleate cis-trans isomerase
LLQKATSMGLTWSRGASYGWRARIGMLQPGIVSDTNPFEFYLMAPPGVELVLTSMGVATMNEENYARAIAGLEDAVRRLTERNVDAIIQSGIPPLVTRGWGVEDELKTRVAAVTPTPYIADAAASIRAMKALGISQPVVLSGFDDELVGLIRVYLAHAGIQIAAHEYIPGEDRGAISLETIYRLARSTLRAHRGFTDGIWITLAAIPSVGVIADLERDLGVPVVSSAQALMWAGLQMAGVNEPITGFGRLFEARFGG